MRVGGSTPVSFKAVLELALWSLLESVADPGSFTDVLELARRNRGLSVEPESFRALLEFALLSRV